MKWLLAFMTVASTLVGALPPVYQDIAELKSILEDPKLGELLTSGDVIETIQKTEDGYLFTTNKRTLQVQVIYTPAAMPGPAAFKLLFGTPVAF